MKPAIVIVGTTHQIQAGYDKYSKAQIEAFTDVIESSAKRHRVKAIVEEMSEDVLPDYDVKETIGKQVANRLGLAHKYLDLSQSERIMLGISPFGLQQTMQIARLTAPQAEGLEALTGEIRECIWVVRTLELNKWPVLFICGAKHGTRLERLFNSVGKLANLEIIDYVP